MQKNRLVQQENRYALLFISPWLLGFLAFSAYPLLYSFYISFTDYNIVSTPNFIGFDNFVKLFQDEYFFQCIKNNLFYAFVGIPLCNTMALCIAVLLTSKIKAQSFFRTIFYLPVMIPVVASSILWKFLYNPDYGALSQALKAIGIQAPLWLQDETWVKPALIFMTIWTAGRQMILYMTAILNIPTSYYEAAAIDGASGFSRFFKITVPLITPIVFYNIIIGLSGSFQFFDIPKIMTDGGPNNSSMTLAMYIYRNAFEYLDMGYAASISWVLFVVIMIISLSLYKSQDKWVHY